MTWSNQQGMAVAYWDFPGFEAAMSSFTASRCLAPQLPAYMLWTRKGAELLKLK
jgi:hypothetical protein